MTMLTADIDSNLHFAYLDSGPPPGQAIYRTWVILHGYSWSASIFQKAVALAPKHGFRIIALNRRGYPGTSPFTSTELEPIQDHESCSVEDVVKFMYDRSVELGRFIKHIVEKENLPKPDAGEGGIALVAWSLSVLYVNAFVEHVKNMPQDIKETIQEYVNTYLLFDPTYEAVGLPTPIPQVLFWPFKKVEPGSEEDKQQKAFRTHIFRNWATGYYDYPLNAPDLQVVSLIQAGGESVKTSTTIAEEATDGSTFLDAFCMDSMAADDVVLNTRMLSVFDKSAERILGPISSVAISHENAEKKEVDIGEDAGWKGLKVNYIWCKNSVWSTIYAANFATGSFGRPGSNAGDRKIVALDDANHFVAWVDPERFIAEVRRLV